jgi:hypothetical protein
MKMSLPSILTIALLAVPIISPLAAHGQAPSSEQTQAEDVQDDQGTPRVARLDFLQGDVSFERAGDKEWVEAVMNLPLLSGDQIFTGDRASAVVQLAHGTYIRLSERTALAITDLSEQGAQFEITAGSAIVQVYRLQDAFGRFEIDTPVAAALLQRDGAYRVQVQDNGETELATREGLAEVTTEDGTLKVRPGYRLQAGGKGSGKLDVVAVASYDDWDLAGPSQDTTIDAVGGAAGAASSASPDYVGSYQDSYGSLYGLDELAGYGTWTNVGSYGNCWIPRVGFGWAPYRSGRWLYVPALGWTWLPGEPWGWAPYHYGRWSFIPGLGWAWVPGFGPQPLSYAYGYRYYAWRPALVYFFNYSTPGGRYVGWQPLRPGEAWHRPDWYERNGNRPGWGRPIYNAATNGVSVLPIGAFNGSAAGRPQAPSPEHARVLQGIDRPRPGAPGVSAGLAGVQPGRLAGVPISAADGGRTAAVQPPAGIIGRPIVTRHLPTVATGDGNLDRRERRVVEPVAPIGQGLNRGSAVGPAAGTGFKSGRQGAESGGLKSGTPSLIDGGGSGDAGSSVQGNRTDERRNRKEGTDSSATDGSSKPKDKATNQGQYNTEQPSNQRHESPRYEAPANRPAHQPEKEAPKSSSGSGGSGSQNNSGGGHSQPHTDSQPHNSGGQSSSSSGHSGSQSSSSSTQGQPSKKN